jgi:hypothetical protein
VRTLLKAGLTEAYEITANQGNPTKASVVSSLAGTQGIPTRFMAVFGMTFAAETAGTAR